MTDEHDYDYGMDIDADEARSILNKVARFCGTMVDIANRITETLDLRDVRRIATDDLPVVDGHRDQKIWEDAPSKCAENSEDEPTKRKRNHLLFAFFRMAQRAATTLNKVLPITTPELFPKRHRGGGSAYDLPGLPGLPG